MSRPRRNQPTGYDRSVGESPRSYYGRRHSYVYFPIGWTDSSSGRSYDGGYYDEDGNRYESISYAKNGRYENVVCICPYCDHRSILTLSVSGPNEQSLKCPNCGATMEIKSALDEETGGFEPEMTRGTAPKRQRVIWPFFLVFGIIALVIIIAAGTFIYLSNQRDPVEQGAYSGNDWDAYESYDDMIRLADNGDGSFSMTDDAGDKILTWEADYDSYYDAESDCYLWYNTDVEPAVWQYWYEGISSDFGDYGWMEHDDDGWWIEADNGSWIPLPETYDQSGLWYIDE